MLLGHTRSVCLVGLSGYVVDVEAHLAPSLPAFTLVGLPDTALAEARDRVRAAVTSSGLAWPNRRIGPAAREVLRVATPPYCTNFGAKVAKGTPAGRPDTPVGARRACRTGYAVPPARCRKVQR